MGREFNWSGRRHLVGTWLCCQLSLCHVMSHGAGRLWDTEELKTLYACQRSWVMGPNQCFPLWGRLLWVDIFLCGRGIHKQISIYDKLTCLHNLEGESPYYPWLGFSFMQESGDWKGVVDCQGSWDKLLAAGFLRKAADGLQEAWGVSQGFPGEYWMNVPVTLGPQSF